MNQNKIAFIIHYDDERYLSENMHYLSKLEVPEGMEVEVLSTSGDNIWNAYNDALGSTDAYYKVFIRQNVFVVNKTFIGEVISIFSRFPEINLMGTMGYVSQEAQQPQDRTWNVGGEKIYSLSGCFVYGGGDNNNLIETECIHSNCIMGKGTFSWETSRDTVVFPQKMILTDESEHVSCYVPFQKRPWTLVIEDEDLSIEGGQKELVEQLTQKYIQLFGKVDKTSIKELLFQLPKNQEYGAKLSELVYLAGLDRYEDENSESDCRLWQANITYEALTDRFLTLRFLLIRTDQIETDGEIIETFKEVLQKYEITEKTVLYLADQLLFVPDWAKAFIRSLMQEQEEPLVSIVLACYNHEKYIGDAIKSVVNQSYKNIELIITDDGSTDHSQEVVNALLEELNDDRIVFRPEITNTAFRCIENACNSVSGKYLTLMGGDDLLERDKIRKQVILLENCNEQYHACFSWVKAFGDNQGKNLFFNDIFNIDNMEYADFFRLMMVAGNHLNASSVLIRKSAYEEVGGYDFSFRQLQDYELWLRILLKHDIFIIPEPLVYYRVVDGSVSDARESSVRVRSAVETERILFEVLDQMTDEVFEQVFPIENDQLRTHVDILCRKILIAEKISGGITGGDVALNLYYKYRLVPEVLDTLSNHYGINRKYFYDLAATRTCMALATKYEQELRQNS